MSNFINIRSVVLEFLDVDRLTDMDGYLEANWRFLVTFLYEGAENSTIELTRSDRCGAVSPIRWRTMGHEHPLFQDLSLCYLSRNTYIKIL
jgi:hypothetical protein